MGLNATVVEINKKVDDLQWTNVLNVVSAVLALLFALVIFVVFCCVKQTGFFKAFSQIAYNGIRLRRNSQGKDSTPASTPNASISPAESEHTDTSNGNSIIGAPAIEFIRSEPSSPSLQKCEPGNYQPDSKEPPRLEKVGKEGDQGPVDV